MKVAIEAGANSGKSTLISLLVKAGFPAADEKAAEVIRGGGPLPWDDYDAFQFEVLRLQKAADRKVDAAARSLGLTSFRDRGQRSGIAYRLLFGLKVPDFFRLVDPHDVDVCLLLESVPVWQADGIRYDNLDLTKALFPVYRHVYEKAGIPVVALPFIDGPVARLDLSLSKLGLKPPPGMLRHTLARSPGVLMPQAIDAAEARESDSRSLSSRTWYVCEGGSRWKQAVVAASSANTDPSATRWSAVRRYAYEAWTSIARRWTKPLVERE